jgi:undecaprenyl-diphosphatase
VTELDVHVFRSLFAAMSGDVVLWVMAALTVIGEGWTLLAFLPLLAFARTRRFGGALIGTCVVTGIIVFSLKALVHRARPCACLTDVHARIFAAPSDYSFPSGHAAGAFACAAFVSAVIIAVRRPLGTREWAGLAAIFVLASGIALSRIALGVHFPGDVAAGALLGSSLGLAGARVHLRAQP